MRVNIPAPSITGNVARIVVVTSTQSQICNNTFDYMLPGFTAGAGDMLNLITAWRTACKTFLLACLSPLTTYLYTLCQDLANGTFVTAQYNEAGGVVGTAGATNLPLEMAAVIERYSLLKGQHGRGHISLPAVPNTFTTPASDPNIINATGVTAYSALYAALLLQLTTTGGVWSPAIITRPVPPAVLPSKGVLVAGWTLRTLLGTVRRRKEGRGE
jgi:hypothetical protein